MALLHSHSIPLKSGIPDFELSSVDDHPYALSDFSAAQVLVILFLCNHCPYVQAIEDRILDLARFFLSSSVQFLAICSNDYQNYPEDSPGELLVRWREKQYPFPYLIDETQEVARSFGAVCTPDIFVYGHERNLAYHGRLDDSWKDPAAVKSQDLKLAITELLAGRLPPMSQISSMGCSIKWKK